MEENVSGSISSSSSPSFPKNHPPSPWKAVRTADPVSLYSFAKNDSTPFCFQGKSWPKAGGTERARERHSARCVKLPLYTRTWGWQMWQRTFCPNLLDRTALRCPSSPRCKSYFVWIQPPSSITLLQLVTVLSKALPVEPCKDRLTKACHESIMNSG